MTDLSPSALRALAALQRVIQRRAQRAFDTGGREEFDPRDVDEWAEKTDAALRAIADRDEAAGWVRVPVEPTEEMLDAVSRKPAHWDLDGPDGPAMRAALAADRLAYRSVYVQMIAAATSLQKAQTGGEG